MASAVRTSQAAIQSSGTIIHGWWNVDGTSIKDEYGNTVRLQGVNIMFYCPVSWWQGKLQTMFNSKLEALGINVIRIDTQMAYFPKYSADMDWIVNWCKQRNIKVIINLHHLPPEPTNWPFPPSIPDGWFDNKTAGDEWIQWWKNVVSHYKNEPTVIGIGLLNEPHGNNFNKTTFIEWDARAKECIRQVKAVNPHIIPFVSGWWADTAWSNNWSNNNIPFFQQDPDFQYDAVFEIHLYPYYVFYDGYAATRNSSFVKYSFVKYYLEGNYQKGYEEMQKTLEDPVSGPNWAGHEGIYGLDELPIAVGEIGYDPGAEQLTNGSFPNAVQQQMTLDLIKLLNKHQLGYAAWVWMTLTPVNNGDRLDLVGPSPTYQESWMYNILKQNLNSGSR